MKNIHIYLLFIVFLFSFPITSADYTNSGTINNERKEKIQNFKKDFNKSRLEKKELISNNIEKIKENRSIISENSIK
ncbi:MAG: hypothetical protein P1U46_03105 [Patescibacteria group bacterium]|nr:hypothetical protein [Patescibacteria group bacterium]